MTQVYIYIKETCPFCKKALGLLDEKNIEYQTVSIASNPAKRLEMESITGRYTVPQIIINGQAIGGCDDLFALDSVGLLDNLLKQAV